MLAICVIESRRLIELFNSPALETLNSSKSQSVLNFIYSSLLPRCPSERTFGDSLLVVLFRRNFVSHRARFDEIVPMCRSRSGQILKVNAEMRDRAVQGDFAIAPEQHLSSIWHNALRHHPPSDVRKNENSKRNVR